MIKAWEVIFEFRRAGNPVTIRRKSLVWTETREEARRWAGHPDVYPGWLVVNVWYAGVTDIDDNSGSLPNLEPF